MRTILSELGLNEKDFKVEILKLTDPEYNDPFTFNPTRVIIAKINGVTLKCSTAVNIEMLNDLKSMTTINVDVEIEKYLKREVINCYINNNQFIRKTKLQKIKDKYE